ncbi:MAG: tRNA pseudouridine(55) synthase TruB, partial [Bacteroidota bacterium]
HRLGLKKIKVGHAGTLDPLASGLLIICTGKMTKSIETFQRQPKQYIGTFYLGASTPSSDLETDPDFVYPVDHITPEKISAATLLFKGEIEQVPPLFSAKKIQGERAYYHARRGEETLLEANIITIHNFEITDIRLPEVDFLIDCSKGTYIRSIARDYGKALHTGAYLKKLRRTQIGDFHVKNALSIQQLQNWFDTLELQITNQPKQ